MDICHCCLMLCPGSLKQIYATLGIQADNILVCPLMNLHNSYFALPDTMGCLTRWLHPYIYYKSIPYDKAHECQISWTRRADKQLRMRHTPLVVEMQLYFSCVVKKRVLFHDTTALPTHAVNNRLKITFRAVQSRSCDPQEFAANFPVQQTFTTPAARHMRPTKLALDFHHDQWWGEFFI